MGWGGQNWTLTGGQFWMLIDSVAFFTGHFLILFKLIFIENSTSNQSSLVGGRQLVSSN